MPLLIPLQAVPSQTVTCNLNGQACTIDVYQMGDWMFLDLYVDGGLIIGGVICQNMNVIVRNSYLGFLGDLAFFDTQASANVPATDPVYTGLGTRYSLNYFAPSELPAGIQ